MLSTWLFLPNCRKLRAHNNLLSKRSYVDESDTYILGISAYYHDSSAALLHNGKVVACAAEERFTRQKHDISFPMNAVEFCLDAAGITSSELNCVSFYEEPHSKFVRVLASTIADFPRGAGRFIRATHKWISGNLWILGEISRRLDVSPSIVCFNRHHRCHAMHAFAGSGFKSSAILVVDAAGEWDCSSIWRGTCNESLTLDEFDRIEYPNSLGLVYSAFTAFLGFMPNDSECSTMALAAFGVPKYEEKIRQVLKVSRDGRYEVVDGYFDFYETANLPFTDKFIKLFGQPRNPNVGLDFYAYNAPDRNPKPSNEAQYYADVAASIQEVLCDAVLSLSRRAKELTGSDKICLAGGVANNAVLISRLVNEGNFNDLYVPPDPGDGGAALGAALAASYRASSTDGTHTALGPFTGKSLCIENAREIVQTAVPSDWLPYQSSNESALGSLDYVDFGNDSHALFDVVASELAKGKVVGWARNEFEFGPRALGNRSILVNPGDLGAVEKLGAQIKKRAPFRPYGLSILDEDFVEILDWEGPILTPLRWMQMTVKVRSEQESRFCGAIHVDGTTRPQVCYRDDNPDFHDLLQRIKTRLGIGALLNTSLNEPGYPIIATAEEALVLFARTPLDMLVLNNLLVRRN